MQYYSPLRYPGGKGKIADFFKKIFKNNLLCDGVYIEPYAGGASVGLSLLMNEYASRIIINDIDRSIYAFWYSVLNNTDKLCKLIQDTPVDVKTWDEQKNIQKKKNKFGILKLGFSTFYLNRTNRSGIINAGIIGGRDQNGFWKINARYNKEDLIKRIKTIAEYKDQIKLFNLDATVLIKSLSKEISKKALFYLDPPYYTKGKDLYLNYYNDNDHISIAAVISNVKKQKWIITYDNIGFIKKLYSNYRQKNFLLNYSAANKIKGKEVMIFSDNVFVEKTTL